MTAADESRVVWRHEPLTEAGQGLLETLDPTDGSALAQILAIEDQAALAARSEPSNTSGDASPAQSGATGATVFVPPVGLAAGVAARSEPRAERLREALSYARLVSQWHGAIGSGPIEVLDGELAELGRLANRELAARGDVRGHFPYHEYPHPTDHTHVTPPAEERPERLAYMKGWDDCMGVRLNEPDAERKDEDSQYAINAALAEPRAEGLEPFWNRRWALFEDEDHRFCVVTDDEAAEYVVWPEMGEGDVRRIVDAHNTVLNVARMPEDAATPPAEGLDVDRFLTWLAEAARWSPNGKWIAEARRRLAPEQPE